MAAQNKHYDGYTPDEKDIVIGRYRLICTCGACPEQYNVYDEVTKAQVGYLRLRHGYFRADVPDAGDETVYESHTKGDGIFDDDERMPELTKAIAAIAAAQAVKAESDDDRFA